MSCLSEDCCWDQDIQPPNYRLNWCVFKFDKISKAISKIEQKIEKEW